nr:hypothetical protein [Tanacetum cinerariifolium]
MVAYLTKSDASEGFNQVIDFLNGSYIKYALTVNPNIYVSCIKQFWYTIAIQQVNAFTRLQALVNKKKVMVTEASIREVLRLDDAKGVDCLPNEEIFTELARMGYEKPSTKLTFYKAFFSSQWKFLIHTILLSMSAKRTSWNEFSSTMVSAIICLSTGRKFNFSKYIFDSLVRNVDSSSKFYMYPHFLQLLIRKQIGNLSTHTTKYASPALTQKVFANMRRVGKGFFRVETPLFEGMLVGQEIDEGGDEEEHVEDVFAGDAAQGDDTAAHGEVPTVQHTPPQSPQAQPQPQPHPQQAADFPMSLLQEALDTYAPLTKRVENLDYDKMAQALEITKLKIWVKKLEKGNRVTGRIIDEMDKYDVVVLMDDKEDDKKDEEAKFEDEPTKKRKLNEEVEDLKIHLEIMLDKDEDVYTEATPLAGKVPVVDYKIIELNNKAYYKIIRVDGTHQLYISFLTLLKNFDREALEALWSLVKERFSTSKPKNFSDDFLLTTLGAMFEKPDAQAQVWKNQRTIHGQAKVKSWKLLESCGVHIITFKTTHLILLIERRYPLSRFTLDQMLNNVRLQVEEESELSLKLLRFTRQQHQEGQQE